MIREKQTFKKLEKIKCSTADEQSSIKSKIIFYFASFGLSATITFPVNIKRKKKHIQSSERSFSFFFSGSLQYKLPSEDFSFVL